MNRLREWGVLILVAACIVGAVLYDVAMMRELSQNTVCVKLSS